VRYPLSRTAGRFWGTLRVLQCYQDEKARVLLGTTLAPGRGADPRFSLSWDVASASQRRGMVQEADTRASAVAASRRDQPGPLPSPGSLDRLDAPALVAFAANGYGASGELRAAPGSSGAVGLAERAVGAAARDAAR
jgi:hypothetical protein